MSIIENKKTKGATSSRINKICIQCGSAYSVRKSRGNSKFCSIRCNGDSRKGMVNKALQIGRSKVVGEAHPLYGKKLPEWWRKKISDNHADVKGEKSPSWKGGINPPNDTFRKSKEYKKWRTSVLERDKYTCVECGDNDSKVIADHIKTFCLHPELALSIDNGQTLCKRCHSVKNMLDMRLIRKKASYIWEKKE